VDTNFYDVVVCGGELTGLVTAALLGQRGFRVLLVGSEADRPTFEAAGHVLSRGPALLPPLATPTIARVLKDLNCVQIVKRRAPALVPALQVVMPHHRFDVGADAEALGRELGREFGGERAAIEAALARVASTSALVEPLLATEITLPPDGFWERREVGRVESMLPKRGADLLAPLPASHPMRAVVAAPAALGGAISPQELSRTNVGQSRAFELARQGLCRFEGGYGALHALFREKLETFSGERREKVVPVEVVMRRGRAVGVRVHPRDETIGCEHLVWAGSAASLHAICAEKPPRRGPTGAPGLHVEAYRYTIALLVAPEALPEGMGERVFLITDPSRPLIEENALVVTVGQPAPRQPEQIPLWVECVVPAPPVDAGPGYLRALRGRVVERLETLLPFFRQHLIVLASPHDGLPPEGPASAVKAATSATLPAPKPEAKRESKQALKQGPKQDQRKAENGAAPASVPTVPIWPMAPVYASEGDSPFDVAALPHATGIKNLYLAGLENLPGLGLEGELVSAWGVSRLITGTQPKRDPLRRQVLINE
jgi:phytoene dehydrogenase-like protein